MRAMLLLASLIMLMGGTFGCAVPPASTGSNLSTAWVIETGARLTGGDLVSPSIITLSNGTHRLFWGGANVSSAISSDEGFTFSKESGPRLEGGGNPAVIQVSGATCRMYYEVNFGSSRSLDSAISSDEGVTWVKEGQILSPAAVDSNFLSVPDALKLPNGKIRLYYVSAFHSVRVCDGLAQ